MCVAIGQMAGADTLTKTQLENGWSSNPHGGGFAYIDRETGGIVSGKSMDRDEFIVAYQEAHAKHGEASPFLVHMRIATHGSVQELTVHPFMVQRDEGEMAFCHNGIISPMSIYTDNDRSDTMAFGDLMLEALPQGWLDNWAICELVEEYIEYSKLVLLTTEPEAEHELYFISESLGDWIEGNWFSNKSCETMTWAKERKGYTQAPYGSYEYYARWGEDADAYSPATSLDEWLSRDRDDLLEEEDTNIPEYGYLTPEDDGIHTPAMSLVLRRNMNSMIVKDTWDQLRDEAEKQGFCKHCLFSPCMCEDTCYYCNDREHLCNCETWVTIADIGRWIGYTELDGHRQQELKDLLASHERMF